MAQTFKFELVSPERVLISANAEQVILPGSDGDMTVLPGHAPVVATLRPGILDVALQGSKARVFVKQAFAQVEPDRLTVLAEKAIDVVGLTGSALASELQMAEAELASAKSDEQRQTANEAVSVLAGLKS